MTATCIIWIIELFHDDYDDDKDDWADDNDWVDEDADDWVDEDADDMIELMRMMIDDDISTNIHTQR